MHQHTNMAIASELWSLFTFGNVLLALLFLLLLNFLIELYEFRGMPPGPRLYSIPFFGNFLSFDSGAGKSLRESTQSLMRQYGKVFSLRMGSFKVVVAASADSVKEVLVKRSGDFANRPPFHSFEILTLGQKDIAIGNYGSAWKLYRKLFVTTVNQYLRNAPLIEGKVTKQVQFVLKYIDDQNGKSFDPTYILASSVANVICGITFGNKFNSSHPDFARLLEFNLSSFGDVQKNDICRFCDFFPFTRYLPVKAYAWKRKLSDGIFEIYRKQLKEAERAFNPTGPVTELIGGLIRGRNEAVSENEEEKLALMSDDYLLATINDMFVAGYETITNTLRWAIAYLTNFPEYQTRIQQELDDVVGCYRFPGLGDRASLPILHAVIMEVQRLGNVLDIAIPHYTKAETTLCDYRVPKDTVVLANVEAVHLDAECWENPEDFNPYRHIDADGKLITNQGNWLPYSAGRRACAGESLAKVELFLFLSIMLQNYTFVPEKGKELPSLKGNVGCIVKSPLPFKVSAVKRHCAKMKASSNQ